MLPMGCMMLGESHHLSEPVFLVWKMSRLEKMVLLEKRSGEWLSKASSGPGTGKARMGPNPPLLTHSSQKKQSAQAAAEDSERPAFLRP